MSFVTDDWANFIVFVLPEKLKFTPFGGKSELVKTCEQNYKILLGHRTYAWATTGIRFHFLVKNVHRWWAR